MEKDFYKEWLGIPEEFRPPTHYQLLGLFADEIDAEKINRAARERMRIVSKYQVGKYAEASIRLSMELSVARAELLNAAARARYDSSLDETSIVTPLPPEEAESDRLDVFKSIVNTAVLRGGLGREHVAMLEAQAERLHIAADTACEVIDQTFANLKKIEELIENGADVNSRDKQGFTPLHYATYRGQTAVAELLLSEGADVNIAGRHGVTPVHEASIHGSAEMIYLLLANGADVNTRDRLGRTPLHWAAARGGDEVAKALIRRGADVRAEDLSGRTPLDTAKEAGNSEVVALLAGADDELVEASHTGDLARARTALAHGASVNPIHKINSDTPLHLAAKAGHEEVVEFLVSKGAYLTARDGSGNTALDVAALEGHIGVFEFLSYARKEADARATNINAKDKGGRTALHRAALQGSPFIVEGLLDRGADPNERSETGCTALHYVAFAGQKDVVELLLDHGADIDAHDDQGATPLYLAAFGGQTDVVALLLRKGADVNAADAKGATPLHRAAFRGGRDVIELLIAAGIDINARRQNGKTALDIAESERRPDVVDLLRKHGGKPGREIG